MGDWYLGGIRLSDFNGSIDDARIYSSALSDEDIAFIYNGGAGDMGLSELLIPQTSPQDNPISVNLRFGKVGSGVIVSGLEESERQMEPSRGTIVPGSLFSMMGTKPFPFRSFPTPMLWKLIFLCQVGRVLLMENPHWPSTRRSELFPKFWPADQISIGGGLMKGLGYGN